MLSALCSSPSPRTACTPRLMGPTPTKIAMSCPYRSHGTRCSRTFSSSATSVLPKTVSVVAPVDHSFFWLTRRLWFPALSTRRSHAPRHLGVKDVPARPDGVLRRAIVQLRPLPAPSTGRNCESVYGSSTALDCLMRASMGVLF